MSEQLQKLVAETLEVNVTAVPALVRNDSESWDSLAHLRLITALEEEYSIEFTMQEIEQIENYPGLQTVLESKSA